MELTTLRGKYDVFVEEHEDLQKQLVAYHNQTAEEQVIEGKGSRSNVVGLVVVDEDGQITMADAPARQMLHLPTGDIVGMPINGAYADPELDKNCRYNALNDQPVLELSDQAHLSLTIGKKM